MIYVKGKNVNMYVYKGSSYVLAICSTNISRRQTVGTIATLTRGAGSNRRYKPTIKEESVTLEGLLTIDTPAQFQFYEFNLGSFYTVRIIYDDLAGNTIQLDGEVLITGIDDNNGASDFSTWSISMVKNGTWSMSGTGAADAVPPIVVSARAIDPHTVRVTFNENVVPTTVGWDVYIFDLLLTTGITAMSGGGTVWDFTTFDAMSPGQTLYLNYNSVTGNTLDLSGNEMATLSLFPIENLILYSANYTGYLHYFNTNPVVGLAAGIDAFTWSVSGLFTHNGPMSFSTSTVPTGKWVGMKEPLTEPIKTHWYNTAFNNGTFGDSVFYGYFEASGWRYYVSRNPLALDTSQPLTAS